MRLCNRDAKPSTQNMGAVHFSPGSLHRPCPLKVPSASADGTRAPSALSPNRESIIQHATRCFDLCEHAPPTTTASQFTSPALGAHSPSTEYQRESPLVVNLLRWPPPTRSSRRSCAPRSARSWSTTGASSRSTTSESLSRTSLTSTRASFCHQTGKLAARH